MATTDASNSSEDCSFCLEQRLADLYSQTKNVFSRQSAEFERPDEDTLNASHPGVENVSFEEALKKCPHLAQKYGNQTDSSIPGQTPSAPSRCPYQNPQSQEWPMRAVLLFIAYNIISTGVGTNWTTILFIVCAYHMGMLQIAEFVTLYLTTASMSNYKLLGLLLMMTNKGGPVFDAKRYSISVSRILLGVFLAVCTVLWSAVWIWTAVYFGYSSPSTQQSTEDLGFSPFANILLPIGMEFVYRGFLLKELGRDLGSWFGITASSGWFCILHRGNALVKVTAFTHGVFWSLCTMYFKGDILPTTTAHVLISSLSVLSPQMYNYLMPN